jgi:hypothetical protein
LTAVELNWILRRRDQVVARLDALMAERGEAAVLF